MDFSIEKNPDTFEFFGSQPVKSSANFLAGNSSHLLLIDLVFGDELGWAALSFCNNIQNRRFQ